MAVPHCSPGSLYTKSAGPPSAPPRLALAFAVFLYPTGASSEALSWVFPLSGLLPSHICISHFRPSLTFLFRSLLTSPQMPSLSSSSVLKPAHPSLQEIPLSEMPCWWSAPRRVRTFRRWNRRFPLLFLLRARHQLWNIASLVIFFSFSL